MLHTIANLKHKIRDGTKRRKLQRKNEDIVERKDGWMDK